LGDGGKRTARSPEALLQKDWQVVSGFLRDHPDFIRNDAELLADLGLRLRADNIVDFGPAALARISAAHRNEATARAQLEATAQANFAAQAQSHAAVVDILEARNHSDLARRVEEIAQLRFGLVTGVIALETPGGVPPGWREMSPGMADDLIGPKQLARMGMSPYAELLFSQQAEAVRSIAMVRMAIWSPARQAVLAFGSADADAFTPDMGAELVAFLARVIERTAERWPVL